ncbi:prostaglandin E synthase Su(P) [Rhynchophorus ferrugineus]|uniref:prostaglandin E synthase Su(P) n=1 Tax=Rhynchophorus ferrugineus TaxID=354439 RepID=UPI003FCD4B4A
MSYLRKICINLQRNKVLINENLIRFNRSNTYFQPIRSKSTSSKPKMKSIFFKLGLTGITVGALVGTGYSIHKKNKPRDHIINEQTFIEPVSHLPKIKPSRRVRYPNDNSGLKLVLFQYQTCPFCCKVRAFLDYYGISYDVVEVDPVLRQSIKWSSYQKVPILVAETATGYQPLNDSTMIISALATYLKDSDKSLNDIVKCFPFITFYDDDGSKKNEIMNKYFLMLSTTQQKVDYEKIASEERKWRKWVDNVFVHTLSPNVYRTTEEAFQAFNWFSEVGEWEKNFPSWERNLIIYVGASAMYLIGKKLKRKYSLKDDVRESLYDECNIWIKEIEKQGSKFHGGDQPDLADLAVYGVLNSIEGCSAFKDLLHKTRINKWYSPMKEAVLTHQGANFV